MFHVDAHDSEAEPTSIYQRHDRARRDCSSEASGPDGAWMPPPVVTAIAPPPTEPVGRMAVVVATISLLLTFALGLNMLLPREGRLRVDLAGRDGAHIERAEVFVDGRKQCDITPCRLTVARGSRTIRVIAPGFASPPPLVANVVAGQEEVLALSLQPLAALGEADSAPAIVALAR